MAYQIQGHFYEACDCEVICSCWGEVDPDGGCTGIFVWALGADSEVGGTDVSGAKVAAVFYGPSCDNASQLLVLIDPDGTSASRTQTNPKYVALLGAITAPGSSWNCVVASGAAPTVSDAPAELIITNPAGPTTNLVVRPVNAAVDGTIEVNAQFDSQVSFRGRGAGPNPGLAVVAVGAAPTKDIDVGVVTTNPDTGSGLNIWVTTNKTLPNAYVFDLDITRVSAVKGRFAYHHP